MYKKITFLDVYLYSGATYLRGCHPMLLQPGGGFSWSEASQLCDNDGRGRVAWCSLIIIIISLYLCVWDGGVEVECATWKQ